MSAPSQLPAAEPLVFISAFAPGTNGAIHAYHLNTKTGALKPAHRTADVENPFYLAVSPDRRFLYSIHAKRFGGKEDEAVAAYRIEDRDGRLKLLNRQSSRGNASCYLAVDATGKSVLVANYSGGSIASLPVRADGSLGEAVSFFKHAGTVFDPVRQKAPRAHSIIPSPDNRFVYAADLGLDQVLGYRLDAATARLAPNDPPFEKSPQRAGPRHLTFHPNGKYLYAINEIENSVTVYDHDADSGRLTRRDTISTLPPDFKATSNCADLKITPDGRFLYGTNRGHDSIAAYRIAKNGGLTLIAIEPSLGKGPQNLALSPDGGLLLCANLPGNNLAVFRIDSQTGRLQAVGEPVAMPKPSCIMVLP